MSSWLFSSTSRDNMCQPDLLCLLFACQVRQVKFNFILQHFLIDIKFCPQILFNLTLGSRGSPTNPKCCQCLFSSLDFYEITCLLLEQQEIGNNIEDLTLKTSFRNLHFHRRNAKHLSNSVHQFLQSNRIPHFFATLGNSYSPLQVR
jgi:hypothetical protein